MAYSFHPNPIIKAVKIFLYIAILSFMLFVLMGVTRIDLTNLILMVCAVGIIFIFFAFLSVRFQTVTLDEKSIVYHSGILSVIRVVLPYTKISEAGYTQGLLQRIFGVGNLAIDSAGGGEMAIRLSDVKYSDIRMVLDNVNKKSGKDEGA